jgi:hypothetical protein
MNLKAVAKFKSKTSKKMGFCTITRAFISKNLQKVLKGPKKICFKNISKRVRNTQNFILTSKALNKNRKKVHFKNFQSKIFNKHD